MKKRLIFPLILFVIPLIFFYQFFLHGHLPIPADTIIGLYHPFRDSYAKNYPNGIPYKNFLITDPVRQQYPWRYLSIDGLQHMQLPLWNPYSLAGTPLLGNVQSAFFYPLNFLLYILPFSFGWSIQVFLQPLLFSFFMYLYLRNLKLNRFAALLSGITIAFCGFSTAWMEWNTVIQTALWLPLILLSIDKMFFLFGRFEKVKNKKKTITLHAIGENLVFWNFLFVFSLCSAFFAGHVQLFFYSFIVSILYILYRFAQNSKRKRLLLFFTVCYILFILITVVQWFPSWQLISHSARDIDLNWRVDGWFIPWQHLIQFLVPDFFGNPTTLNYWGIWNYGELVGYVGVVPLIFALYAIFSRRDSMSFFFLSVLLLSLLFALPTPFAAVPFLWNIPFFSTAQPTRLLFLTDFSLVVLAGLGFDTFLKQRRHILYPLASFFLIYGIIWLTVMFGTNFLHLSPENVMTSKRNLYLPTAILIIGSLLLILIQLIKQKHYQYIVVCLLIIFVSFDLFRFFTKFTPFTDKTYLFPQTKTLSFLQKNVGFNRIMETDSRILPPNFSSMYKLQSIDGYDPLYLRRYGELLAASERGKPDIAPPFGFNRIITPQNYSSKIIDLLGVKYILSFSDITSPKLRKVFQEGETRVYENSKAMPRVFMVKRTYYAATKQEAIDKMMDKNFDLHKEAVIEYQKHPGGRNLAKEWTAGEAKIIAYTPNSITVETNVPSEDNEAEGFLVLVDSYDAMWRVETSNLDIPYTGEGKVMLTDYNFRGTVVSHGRSRVTFYNTLFPNVDL